MDEVVVGERIDIFAAEFAGQQETRGGRLR